MMKICLVVALVAAFQSAAFADGNTDNFSKAMTICGAEINLKIDANLKSFILSAYQKARTEGEGVLEIAPMLSAPLVKDLNAERYIQIS